MVGLAAEQGGWRQEAVDVVRGMTGGLLIGTPLIYTLETWTIGATTPPLQVLVLLAVAYVLNLGGICWAGFRQGEGGGAQLLADALEATALAIVSAGLLLVLLNRIRLGDPAGVIAGRLAVAAVPISLGIAIANHLIPRNDTRTEEEPDEGIEQVTGGRANGLTQTLLELGASAGGALFFCLNIAPTDEVRLLATELPELYLPVLILFTLLVTYGIVFVADFTGRTQRWSSSGPLQHPATETVVAYLVAIVVGGGTLWLFGQIGPDTDWGLVYAEVIVIGLPAAIGGAAGRLAV
ncbi:MAG: TIGR02587 family membrane protein [Chloroflexota bacterium]|nr:TIGR02587 family membrane protein [Chloroflexota bacterium]